MSPEEIESAVAFGGKHITVRFRPLGARPAPPAESVLVRLLPLDPSLVRYIELCQAEAELADFVCEKPAGWGRSLTPLSLLEIVETAHALNFPIARRYAEHRARVAEDLIPINRSLDGLRDRISAASAPASG